MRELRDELLRVRGSLSKEEASINSSKIVQNLLQLEEFLKAENILFYFPKGKEADLTELMEFSFKEGKTILFPKTNPADCSLAVRQVKDLVSDLGRGEYGIKEPKNSCPEFNKNKLNLIFVPGVGFDQNGNRLGQGKGYYDRFLKDLAALKVGIAYEFQLVNSLIAREHDVPMDYIVTEKRVIKIKEINPNKS